MVAKSCEKIAKKFQCVPCDYTTSRSSSLDKHNLTIKHRENIGQNSCEKGVKKFQCVPCDYTTSRSSSLHKHNLTIKHIHREKNSCEKGVKKFQCVPCDYTTSRSSSLDKHNLTIKHIHRANIKPKSLQCKICNKIYICRNSLWYHEKKCKTQYVPDNIQNVDPIQNVDAIQTLSALMIEMVKSNTELQKQMLEVCKNSYSMNSNNIT
jgi:hypothetical protein